MQTEDHTTKRDMHILMPVLHYPPVIGGFEVFIQNIAERIGKETPITILTGKVAGTPKKERIQKLMIKRNASLFTLDDHSYSSYLYIATMMPILFLSSLYHILFKKVTLLHAQGFFSGILCLGLKLLTRMPYVLTIQSADFTVYHSEVKSGFIIKAQDWVEKQVYKQAAVCHAVSHDLVNHYKNQGRADGVMIPNGVETNIFHPIPADHRIEYRKKMGVETTYVISCLSRLQEKNGTHVLVDAMHILCQKRDDVSLVIIGDGVERNRIEGMIEAYHLEEKVKLVGHVLHDDVGAYIAATDMFCRPSLAEGFGIVYLEAMACDIPAVATPVGGIVDFLKHEETGLMSEVDNPEDLAHQLERLLDDKELYDHIVHNARKMIDTTYSWDAIAQDIAALYAKI